MFMKQNVLPTCLKNTIRPSSINIFICVIFTIRQLLSAISEYSMTFFHLSGFPFLFVDWFKAFDEVNCWSFISLAKNRYSLFLIFRTFCVLFLNYGLFYSLKRVFNEKVNITNSNADQIAVCVWHYHLNTINFNLI